MLVTALLVLVALMLAWFLWERRTAQRRDAARALNLAGEDVIGAAAPAEIVRKLSAALTDLIGATGAGIFTCNRQTQALESFYGEGTAREYTDMAPESTPIFEAASTAARNRILLSVPDTRRSPLFKTRHEATPRSALFVPMAAQSELLGILEVESSQHVRHFTREQTAALQHLANQVAAALKIQEQQSVREQLFRTEKLASSAQLMSAIANELRAPLESIVRTAEALRRSERVPLPEIVSIVAEGRRASEIVQRLLEFSRCEATELEKVDINDMLSEVAALHASAIRSKNIAIRCRLATQALIALGSREQLAQVMLNLLIYAEQYLVDARTPTEIRITSALLARRAVIEIAWPVRASEADPARDAADLVEKTGLSLDICQGIVHNHGGDLRVCRPGGDVRFELDLPVIEMAQRPEPRERHETGSRRRQLTVLVVEPEAAAQRHVVSTLTKLGHRVVPVASAEEGADLAERMRFDLAVCAFRLPGLRGTDFLDRVRNQVGGVALLTDAYDPNVAPTYASSDVYVLSKPVDAAEIARICETIAECGEGSAALSSSH